MDVDQPIFEIGIADQVLSASLTQPRFFTVLLGVLAVLALVLASLGIVVGLGAALALIRVMEALLFEVGAADLLTYLGVAVSLLVVAGVACVEGYAYRTRWVRYGRTEDGRWPSVPGQRSFEV